MKRFPPPDTVIILIVFGLLSIGATMVYSASSIDGALRFDDPGYFMKKHGLGILAAIILCALVSSIDYHRIRAVAMPLLFITIFTLAAMNSIPNLSREAGGASRWLQLGAVRVQPSELAKFSIILFMADFFSQNGSIERPGRLITATIVLGGVSWMILAQRDLSTSFIVLSTGFIMFFVAGISPAKLAVGLGVISGGVAHAIFFEKYRLRRIMAFLDPWSDPYDSGYHVIQSLIAVGSGGLNGLGLTASRQKLRYLPEPFTDFIFAIIGEELGFVGAVTVVALFLAFIVRGIKVARSAPDLFGMLLSVGVIAWISVQAFVNMGVVLNLVPATGLPLPFLSYGRSSLLSISVGIGVLLSVSRQRIIK